MSKSLAKRLLVAVIGLPLIIAVFVFLPPIAAPVTLSLVCGVCAAEFMHAVARPERRRVYVTPTLAAACIPFGVYFGYAAPVSWTALFVLNAVLFLELMMTREGHRRLGLEGVFAGIFCGVVIPRFLSTLLDIKAMEHGAYLVLLPFVISMSSDTGGYFVGLALGKHHPFKELSPKKSSEGCVGSLLFGVAFSLAYGLLVQAISPLRVNFPLLALVGLLSNPFVQFGDLAFSAIKREVGIKDFSRLLGDHGGYLDRFDSTIFSAPVVWAMLWLLPVFT